MKATYNIIGEISPFEWDSNAASLIKFFTENKEADEYEIIISSFGGVVSEGFAMADAIRSLSGGKPVTTVAFTCMSIATVVFLAGDNRLIAENSEFMIHNPWIGLAAGDAEDMRKAADDLERIEEKLAAYYAKYTEKKEKDLRDMMKEETFISAEDAINMRFATAMLEEISAIKRVAISGEAVAYMSTPKQNSNSKIMTKIEKMVEGISARLGVGGEKALKVALKDGDNMEIDSNEMKAKVGDAVISIGGNEVKDGEYETAQTGEAIVVKAGKIEEIKDVSELTFSEGDVQAFGEGILAKTKDMADAQSKAFQEMIQGYVSTDVFAKHQEEVKALKEEQAKANEEIQKLQNVIAKELKEIKAHVLSDPSAGNQQEKGEETKYPGLDPEEVETHEAMMAKREEYAKSKK
jgi:ATP-dependent protease ClpP protease subunit